MRTKRRSSPGSSPSALPRSTSAKATRRGGCSPIRRATSSASCPGHSSREPAKWGGPVSRYGDGHCGRIWTWALPARGGEASASIWGMTSPAEEGLVLDLGRTALVLLDYQNYNVHPDGYWASVTPGLIERVAPALERSSHALAAARASGICVIHVQNAWRQGHPDINLHAPWQADAKAAGRSTEGSWG